MPSGPSIRAATTVALLLAATAVCAQSAPPSSREVPAKSIPVPTTVSPQLQQIIAQPLRSGWDTPPTTPEGWKQLAETTRTSALPNVQAMRERLKVRVEPGTLGGVRIYTVTPEKIQPRNRDRVLVQVHGGCYVLNPAEAALPEAMLISAIGGYRVIAVDYRMPPQAYFPGALDDAMAVYRAVIARTKPKRVGLIGTSAGGALVLEMGLRARQLGLPLPGAMASGTPMSDSTKAGDTFQTNARVDNVLVSPDGFCDAAAAFYANGHDMKDPLISPVYGDMSGFPPTILTSGTRDLLLSNTVRVHRKLRNLGIDSFLQVYEGQSHAQYGRDDRIPETQEAFGEIARFFDTHLAR
ncbi:alpha/beta hydrolase [Ramlibacter sp.]|uniref:alpha/beta hydrolase n=1 Tax=Ramlibacter sp. TaxID=1917967 RepID=UPI00262E30C7|nr:alpha/beta hydrolase [Ramlibacter sp.]MDB5956255.1 aes [Ramlibacter sp.]